MDRDLSDFAYSGSYGPFSSSGSSTSSQTSTQTARQLAEIQKNVQHFANNVATLERKSEYLDTSQETERLREEIIQLVADTAQLAKITNASVQKIRLQTRNMSFNDRNMFERLMSTFASSGVRFKNLQRVTTELEQKRLLTARQRQRSSSAYSDDTQSSSQHEDKAHLVPQDKVEHDYQSEMMLEAHRHEVEEREQNMRQLETDILDINEIFRDLGTMVHEQGEVIDHIEASVEIATTRVEQGNTQLQKAASAKRCNRKMTLVIVIVVAVIVIAIVIGVLILLGVLKVFTSGTS